MLMKEVARRNAIKRERKRELNEMRKRHFDECCSRCPHCHHMFGGYTCSEFGCDPTEITGCVVFK